MGYFKRNASSTQSHLVHRWDGKEATRVGGGRSLNPCNRARAYLCVKNLRDLGLLGVQGIFFLYFLAVKLFKRFDRY